MMKSFCKWMLYDVMGWKSIITEEHPQKYIICLAPHTSNWDFIIGQLYSRANGVRSGFLMKKEWFFWPLGPIFRSMGGIPVYRQKKMSMTDSLIKSAKEADTFQIAITPEGTRKPVSEWKHGFYYIALGAKIPILLYGIDYEKKEIVCTRTIIPTGDYNKDIILIKNYYRDFVGKKPQNFII
ncbi:MAG: 1-acyl-sn-glycerol-3-phosphate acyltransferase [Bacteroidales bacterium]|nr:1-acyl-sn-glycerol-3-phosphate acyltransferase [Bacteroidales bacterium]